MAEYIEREAVLENIKRMEKEVSNAGVQPITGVIYLMAMKHALDYVAVTPSADVAPVRHGRWEKNDDGIMVWWECSECHRNAWYDGYNLFDYCPDCGATMMDGGET